MAGPEARCARFPPLSLFDGELRMDIFVKSKGAPENPL